MNLVLNEWIDKDIKKFEEYLQSLNNPLKVEWTRNIICTKYPLLAIKTPVVKDIAKEISRGNFESFLNYMPHNFYDSLAVNGFLIPKIKDFSAMKNMLDKYSDLVDCWAGCDLLKFNVKNNEENFLNLASDYIKSPKTFVRRIGVIILFNFTKSQQYLDMVFKLIKSLKQEQEYYVNMAVAWLVAELMIHNRNKTLEFLKTEPLNDFTINKAVQKCRDSFRVGDGDKQMLLKYKK